MKRGCALACLLAACSPSGSAPADGAAADGAAADADGAPPEGDAAASTACGVTRAAAPALPGSRDPMVLARAAAIVGSCITDDGIDRNLSYMWSSSVNYGRYWDRYGSQADCLAAAKCGCAAVEECLAWKPSEGTAEIAPHCTGEKFEMCQQPVPGLFICFSFDCVTVGLSCDPVAICAERALETCGAAASQSKCDSRGRVIVCDAFGDGTTVIGGADCAAAGLACANGECVGSGAACTAGNLSSEGELRPEGLACAGTMLDACVGGKRATLDCAKLGPGFSCQSAAGRYFCGLASECVPGNVGPTDAKCEGTTVVFCNAGRVARVDCTSLGFTGCEVDSSKGHYGCIPGIMM